MIGNLIGGFVIILIGTVLAPSVANLVVQAQYPVNSSVGNLTAGNLTGASSTILGLVSLFYILGVASVGISVAVTGLKQAGVF